MMLISTDGKEPVHQEIQSNSEGTCTSQSSTGEQNDVMRNLVSSHFNASSPLDDKVITLGEAISKHCEFVRRECRAAPEDILGDL